MVLEDKEPPWLPRAEGDPGQTAGGRAQNVLEKHRHWSVTGGGEVPTHPRFNDWKPRKPTDLPGGKEDPLTT